MGSIQSIARIAIVLELQFLPALSRMAPRAVRVLFALVCPHELSLMRILMARLTVRGNRLHPHDIVARADLPHHVALETGLLAVLAF